MAILWYAEILVAFLCFLFLWQLWRWSKQYSAYRNWHVFEMLRLLQNASHVHVGPAVEGPGGHHVAATVDELEEITSGAALGFLFLLFVNTSFSPYMCRYKG
jgi:hypothetical protein